jgi:tellurite resistance protein TehA-like permease
MAGGRKKEYLNDYVRDENGKYSYKGKYLTLDCAESEHKKITATLICSCVIITVTTILSGCINAGGMNNTFYVILPYIAEVAALFFSMRYMMRLILEGRQVKEYVYKATVPKIPTALAALAVCAVISFVCSLVFDIIGGFKENAVLCILYLCFKLIEALMSFTLMKYFNTLSWKY